MVTRFLLTSFDYLRPKDPSISLASSSLLASLLKSKQLFSHKLEIHHKQYNVRHTNVADINSQFKTDIDKIKPDFIGLGIYIWNERFIQEAMRHVVLNRDFGFTPKKVICGGPQITYHSNKSSSSLEMVYPFGDIFIRGYAEESLVAVLENLMTQKEISVPGVHNAGQTDTGQKSIYNFEDLPSPFSSTLQINHKAFIRLETKRGCPFTCSFCQHKDSYEKRAGCKQSRVEKDIAWLVQQGIEDVSIVDPIFNSGGSSHLQTMQSFLDYGYKGRLSLQSRFEMVSSSYLEMCSKLLSEGIQVELEFGVQTVNKQESVVIQRTNNLRKIVKTAQDLKSREIPFETSLIYGLPLQTVDTFRFGMDWVTEFLKPTIAVHAWPLMLLKGTPLFDLKEKFKLQERILDESLETVENDEKRIYAGIPHVVASSSFSEKDWNEMKSLSRQVLEMYQ